MKIGKVKKGAVMSFRGTAGRLDLGKVYDELASTELQGSFSVPFELDEDERDEESITTLKNAIRAQVRRHGLMASKPFSVNVVFEPFGGDDTTLTAGIRKIALREPRGPRTKREEAPATTVTAASSKAAAPANGKR